jgi:hypothetical protein
MKEEQIDITTWINDSSYPQNEKEKYYRISAYTSLTFFAKKDTFHYKLGNNHIVSLYGSIEYFIGFKYHLFSTEKGLNIAIDSSPMDKKKTEEGLWLLLLIPYVEEGKPADYIENEIIGIFSMFFGQNYAYENVFRNDYRYADKNFQMYGPAIESPDKVNKLDITKENMDLFSEIISRLDREDEEIQKKVLSSLRWYRKANGQFGVEGFIYLWTALEIIGKNGTQELKILKEKMIDIYEIDETSIESITYIGHIESFRGRVLHQGFDKPINNNILDYIRSIIDDLIIYEIIKERSKRALIFLSEHRKEMISAIDSSK